MLGYLTGFAMYVTHHTPAQRITINCFAFQLAISLLVIPGKNIFPKRVVTTLYLFAKLTPLSKSFIKKMLFADAVDNSKFCHPAPSFGNVEKIMHYRHSMQAKEFSRG